MIADQTTDECGHFFPEANMAHSLNLTIKIGQDAETQKNLTKFVAIFPTVQGKIADAMKKSKILHFARIVVIGNEYLQVLTEYDGDRREYTEFFRQQLPDVFQLVFALAEGAPPWSQLQDPDAFFNFTKGLDIKPLGTSVSNDPDDRFVFSAYGDRTVKEILAALATAGATG
jgi:hypothetical protein